MAKKESGYIYIFTNPSFPQYVKIGYADNVERRLKTLNRNPGLPYAFRIYATYEVNTRLTDMKVHSMIDKLNPELRCVETYRGKKRVREFYAMSAEDAYLIFEVMAEIHGTEKKLKKYELTHQEKKDQKQAKIIEEEVKEKAKPFRFSMCNIPVGAVITYARNPKITCVVVDDRHVKYNNEVMSLTGLAKLLLGNPKSHVPGPKYFMYKGEYLNEIRKNLV